VTQVGIGSSTGPTEATEAQQALRLPLHQGAVELVAEGRVLRSGATASGVAVPRMAQFAGLDKIQDDCTFKRLSPWDWSGFLQLLLDKGPGSHPTFSLTQVTLLLQRHANANMSRATAGVRKTAGMVSVDLLMDLLIKNHIDAESRVLSQGISPFQYLTGIDPYAPPPQDPLDLLDQPEEQGHRPWRACEQPLEQLSSERDCMLYVRRLKEWQNVIEVFRVTHPHGFFVLEAPEPKCWCGQVIAKKYTLLCANIVSGIGDVRVLPWQMACHIGAKDMLSRSRL
jgi:hypothetical protein